MSRPGPPPPPPPPPPQPTPRQGQKPAPTLGQAYAQATPSAGRAPSKPPSNASSVAAGGDSSLAPQSTANVSSVPYPNPGVAPVPAPFPSYESTRDRLGVNEPYGQVHSGVAHRRTTAESTRAATSTSSPYYYGAGASTSSTSYSGHAHQSFTYGGGILGTSTTPGSSTQSTQKKTKHYYEHNRNVLFFLVPPLLLLFWRHESPYPFHVFLFVCLILYSLDLANLRDVLDVFIWFGIASISAVSGWFILIDEGETGDQHTNDGLLVIDLMLRITAQIFLLCCWGCWITLQFKWLHEDCPERAIGFERFVHSTTPVISAGILCFQLSSLLADDFGIDSAATLSPYIFMIILALAMIFIGSCPTSYPSLKKTNNNSQKPTTNKNNISGQKQQQQNQTDYILSGRMAKIHSIILILCPPLIHTAIFFRRILSIYASYDELYDLILVWTTPYLVHYGINLLHSSGTKRGPYHRLNLKVSGTSAAGASGTNGILSKHYLRETLIPFSISILTSVALQNRYLIPFCSKIGYLFQGHNNASGFVISLYLSATMISVLFSIWIWGRNSTVTGEPLFGEYHEDVIQLSFIVTGFFAGKSLGMPWSLLPLPVLALLGICLWVTTGLLRYLSVFLFVLDAAAVVLLGYRFAGMDMTIDLAIPGIHLSLVRFGTFIVLTSVLICFVAGLAIRSSGGFGAKYIRKFDITGMLLCLYSILFLALECTLLTQPVPTRELVGIELDISEIEDNYETLYDHSTAFFTSGILIGLALYLKRRRKIKALSSVITISLAIGKAIAVFIDVNEEFTSTEDFTETDTDKYLMFFRSISAMALFVIMVAPKVFLSPIHVKTSGRPKRRYLGLSSSAAAAYTSDGKPITDIPAKGKTTILIYSLMLLPIAIILAIQFVFFPLISVFSKGYYDTSTPISELFGYALLMWGLSTLYMLNHFLPDGGGELWKKGAASTFLMGTVVIFAAPSLPGMSNLTANTGSSTSASYASISSLGLQLIQRSKSRSGGWGLLSASLATLLAVTGPLELRERKFTSGKKDNSFLARLMIFSVMFGCGVSWFVMMQSMREENTLMLVVSSVACMAISFFGTVTAVLGYFLELENFEEAEQVAQVWFAAFPILIAVSSIPQVIVGGESMHPFGTGGWLSTYLAISSLIMLAFTLVLRARSTKNAATRGLANISCVLSWACANAVLYGRYGVAGLDSNFGVTTVLGFPASIVGTFIVSTILLALEGEQSESGRRSTRVQRLQSGPAASSRNKNVSSSTGMTLNLQRLNNSKTTRFVPLIAGTVLILLLASLYVITLRGSGLFSFFGGEGYGIAKSHDEVASNFFKKASDAFNKDGGKDQPPDLAALAEQTMIHSQALKASVRLAGSGFWTSKSIIGPLLHIGGILATLPSLYLLIAHIWFGNKIAPSHVTMALPLNVIPAFICLGIPNLRAAALVSLFGGMYQLWNMKNLEHKSRMRI